MRSEGTVEAAARRVVAEHEGERCAQCGPSGWCDLLQWARLVVAAEGLPHPHG